MIQAIQACTYDKPKDNKPAEDVAEFEGDDPYDDIRYACDSAENYFETANREFEMVQKREKLLQTLHETQNWTGFYRQMGQLETGKKMQVVSRFHRRPRH